MSKVVASTGNEWQDYMNRINTALKEFFESHNARIRMIIWNVWDSRFSGMGNEELEESDTVNIWVGIHADDFSEELADSGIFKGTKETAEKNGKDIGTSYKDEVFGEGTSFYAKSDPSGREHTTCFFSICPSDFPRVGLDVLAGSDLEFESHGPEVWYWEGCM